jgi:hydroxymethylpyrimidine pyrophosphatase-like HAD family hydrolase
MQKFAEKDLVIFDLDGTLAESKQVMDSEMTALLARLLERKKVAVISGGSFAQFEKQFLPGLEKAGASAADATAPFPFSNLFLLPTTGSTLYIFKKGTWAKEYSHDLSAAEKEKIYAAFDEAVKKSGEKMPTETYGPVMEDRGGQVTFSADGQEAPIAVKAEWDPTEKKRLHIVSFLAPLLPEFSIGIGGMTSIDVTKKGIDKAFGVRKICDYIKIPIEKALYVGDALFPGGNDYAARASGVECAEVANVAATKKLIREILAA